MQKDINLEEWSCAEKTAKAGLECCTLFVATFRMKGTKKEGKAQSRQSSSTGKTSTCGDDDANGEDYGEDTMARTPQQNGRAERLNRTLLEKMRCLLFHSGVPAMFWAEAIATANYLRNRLPSRATDGKTPCEMFSKLVPDASELKVFGCVTFAHVPAQLRKKLDKCSSAGVFVGYEANKKAWRVLCQSRDGSWQLHLSRDVRFDETVMGYAEGWSVCGYC